MRALITGWGSIGRRHAECLRTVVPQCEIVVWRQQATDTPANRAAVNDADRVVFSADDALATKPDFAIIANPAPYHAPTAGLFAGRGIPMLIEKPLADTQAAVAALRRDHAAHKSALMVGYVLRFHPALIALRDHLRSGAIGDLRSARLHVGQHLADWRPGTDWRQGVSARRDLGGGALLELSHEIDLALWLFGSVSSVTARIAPNTLLDIDVEDNADLQLLLHNGRAADIHLDMLSRPARRTVTITGSTGELRADLIAGTAELKRHSDTAWTSLTLPPLERNDIYKRQIEHFLDSLQFARNPSIGLEDGAAVLAVIDAARQSAAESRRIEL
jgi:predicted dehydrogenase